MQIVKCFRYRLYPTAEQEQKFVQFAGCRRHVWNWALDRKKSHYLAHKENLTYNVLAGELVKLKKEREFLKECHSQILQQSLMDLESAFRALPGGAWGVVARAGRGGHGGGCRGCVAG